MIKKGMPGYNKWIHADVTQWENWKGDLGKQRIEVPNEMVKSLRESMKVVRKTSQKDYLSGPRPMKLDKVSGRLKRSLRYSVTRRRDMFYASVYSKLFYANFWEGGFGKSTGRSHRKGGFRRADYGARPFIRPAFDDNEAKIANDLELSGWKVLR